MGQSTDQDVKNEFFISTTQNSVEEQRYEEAKKTLETHTQYGRDSRFDILPLFSSNRGHSWKTR